MTDTDFGTESGSRGFSILYIYERDRETEISKNELTRLRGWQSVGWLVGWELSGRN